MIKKILRDYKFWLTILLALAAFVRVYRLNELLGFYYDQGRDGLVIWKFWHEGKFFLIGPTTGIEGIFRGPWYYWLIAPFYLISGGDPIAPAVFLAATTVLAIFILFYLTSQIAGKLAGFIAVAIASFSYFFITAARWFSNPTPMFVISMLFLYCLFKIIDGKKKYWVVVLFLAGLAMQFGSATEVFLFPALVIFGFWQRKNLPSKKIAIIALSGLFLTLLPQVVFDLRHDGILSGAIKKFLFAEKSFQASFWEVVLTRVDQYKHIFFLKLFPTSTKPWNIFLAIFLATIIFNARSLSKNKKFATTILVFLSPLLGMVFFQGNQGNVYDYYFTGYYFIFVILFSVTLARLSKNVLGKAAILLFFLYFLQGNVPIVKNTISAGTDGPETIVLKNELEAVNWVIDNAEAKGEFNVDVYVPPVIPYSYDYLFLWQGTKRCGASLCNLKLDRQVSLLYTLAEHGGPHGELLKHWFERQDGIGKLKEEVRFGGVSVGRRIRVEK